eukprot:6118009-Pyramimonas_sp.AAC.1
MAAPPRPQPRHQTPRLRPRPRQQTSGLRQRHRQQQTARPSLPAVGARLPVAALAARQVPSVGAGGTAGTAAGPGGTAAGIAARRHQSARPAARSQAARASVGRLAQRVAVRYPCRRRGARLRRQPHRCRAG